MSRKLIGFSSLAAAVALVYGGCGGDSTEPPLQVDPVPTRAVVAAGDDQTGTVGQALPAPLVVQVNDQTGSGMQGVTVSFAVTHGGGSVSGASATTDGAGQASTNWTLGTAAGTTQQVTATVTGATNVTTTFSATAAADAAAVISPDSGDGQNAFHGTKVPQLIVVLVRDQFANGVAGELVQFVAPSGSGSLDSTVAFTDATGRARTGWTLGSDLGDDTAQALVQGLTGSPVTFTAIAHDLNIETVTPNPLVLGATGTITGSGFDASPANNVLTIGNEAVTVTAASPTQLDFDVPSTCTPAGSFDVKVAVGSLSSAPKNANLEPAAFLSMVVGEQVIIQDPTQFCLQFDESVESESYLVGVQSVTEVASSRTLVTVASVVAPGGAVAPAAAPPAALTTQRRSLDPERARLMELALRHRIAETRILGAQLDLLRNAPTRVRPPAAPGQVPSGVQVGDTVAIRVSGSSLACTNFEEVTTVAREVTARVIWLEDIDNPAGGYTTADFQSFGSTFEDMIYDEDVAYFGQPSDIDANGQIAIVTTKEVNLQNGPAGFVAPLDYLDPAVSAASNQGELVYLWAPDPNGDLGFVLTTDMARTFANVIAAHEFVHIIQVGRRVDAGNPLPTIWELEGQASLGEEIIGHLMEGNSPGQDLPGDVALDPNGTASGPWYEFSFIDLMYYYGGDVFALPTPVKLPGAPEDCTWLARVDDHACVFAIVNGVPWSFLRWLSDHFGPNFAGGEQEFQRALIDNDLAGFENIATLVGVPIETLLAQWAAMLYIDNRILDDGTQVVADPIITMLSWNMFDIFEGFTVFGGVVHRLDPRRRGFADFSTDVNVRAASTAYFIVSGDGRSATALGATDTSGQTLPQQMQLWVVRMK